MKRTVSAGLAAIVMVLSAITIAVPGNAAVESSIVPGQIMVKFRDSGAAVGLLRQHGLSDGPPIGSTGAHLIKVPSGKELQVIGALSRNPAVEYAEPDEVVTPTTDDPFFGEQYALQNTGQDVTNNNPDYPVTVAGGTSDADVDAVEAWTVTTGTDIRVAVLDSGVDGDHEDISSKVVARANFSSSATKRGDVVAEDYYGHGTHVAGIVAATQGNSRGVSGVCPGCTILAGKVLSDTGMGSTSALANGINWAVQNKANVISMSLAVRASRTLEAAVNNAWQANVVLVAAAGNGGNENKFYPGAYPNVIAVGATDNNDGKASFSTYGASWVDIAAPGVAVYSTFPNHDFALAGQNHRALNYDIGSGTSMATPIVAAVAALVWKAQATPTASSVRASVESSGDTKPGTETYWAHGRVNACKAVGCMLP